MTDKEKKNKIADILLDFYDEYRSNEINRPMIPSIYAGKIIDSLQEEPTIPDIVDEHYWEMLGEEPQEPVSEELEEAAYHNCIDRLSKESIEDFKAGAKWQKLQDMGITNNRAQDVVANILSSADNPLDAYATEVAFIMLPATLKESYHQTNRDRIGDAVKLGAKWKENHLWKPADGDDLPIFDREVIALLNNGKAVFAHRPYKGKYIGKNLTTGNIETYENETYGKGEWNIPNAKYWLDVELPKETEL